jgi:NAD+ kinase
MTTVGVFARPGLKEAGPVVGELTTWLRARGVRVCLEEGTAAMSGAGPGDGCLVASGRVMAEVSDALVVLGGDGTLLAASRLLDKTIPVLGVNFGSLGFLTEITLGELYPSLAGVLEGRHEHEQRRLLRATVHRRGQAEPSADVLNDVVITKAGPSSRIIQVDVTVDGLFVSSFRADGIIVSSPTGSTAYNLAAGGPILHPTLPAVVITPICPHTLTNRPLVVSDEARIEVRLRASRDVEVYAALDGQETFAFGEGDYVEITGSPRRLELVKAAGRDYYQVLRSKLKWGDAGGTSRRG